MQDISRDASRDVSPDASEGRWMSYAELAQLRGIDKQSAARLTFRRRWRRQKDNHGTVRVLVPPEWQEPQDTSGDASRDISPDFATAIEAVTEAFEAALSAKDREIVSLREQWERAMAYLDAERSRADELRERLDRLGVKLTDAQAELATAQDQAEAANALAEAAQLGHGEAEADAAELRQAETERRARGVLARLRAAWRGE